MAKVLAPLLSRYIDCDDRLDAAEMQLTLAALAVKKLPCTDPQVVAATNQIQRAASALAKARNLLAASFSN